MFIDKVQAVENKFMDLEQRISDPAVIARQDEWQKLTREHASLSPIVETYRKYKDVSEQIAGDRDLLKDPDSDAEIIAMAKEELADLEKEQASLEEELHILMLPKDPRDDKNVIMEIRSGAGGDEAALFAGDLFRMYMKYIEKQPGWKASIISSNEPELGGFKEVIFSVQGLGNVLWQAQNESGVHRVQRVHVSEAGAVFHTSTATVAVLAGSRSMLKSTWRQWMMCATTMSVRRRGPAGSAEGDVLVLCTKVRSRRWWTRVVQGAGWWGRVRMNRIV